MYFSYFSGRYLTLQLCRLVRWFSVKWTTSTVINVERRNNNMLTLLGDKIYKKP